MPIATQIYLLPAVAPRPLGNHPPSASPFTAMPVSAESGANAAASARPWALLGSLDGGQQAVADREQQGHEAFVDPYLLAELPHGGRVRVAARHLGCPVAR